MSLVVGTLACFVFLRLADNGPRHPQLSWWAIACISIVAELMVFNVEFRREVFTFTFSEVPLVLGLFLASPLQLVLGRLIGEALFLIIKERQRFAKLSLNIASFSAECAVMLTVYHLIGGATTIDHPRAWIDAFIAVSAADLVGFIVIAYVVRWHGGPLQLRSILVIGALTAPVNISLALTTGVLLTVRPWSTLLLGGVAGFLVLSYRSYSALTQRFDSLSLLYDFTRLVSGAQRPEVVLQAILTQAKDLLRAERAEIWLTDERGGLLALAVDDAGRTTRELPTNTGIVVHEFFRSHPDATILLEGDSDPLVRDLTDTLHAAQCIVAPVTEAGAVVGLVAVVNRLGNVTFRAQDGPLFATLANHASVALENGRLIVRLNQQASQHEHESLHDALTGLPNRVLFGRRLDDLVAGLNNANSSVAVAVMDLDGFKEINDTLGHLAGDRALLEVANRIRRTTNPSVTVARLGGDEFALLFPHPARREVVESCARAIQAELLLPTHIDNMRITFGISIGVALGPLDGTDAAVLLQRADVAMYCAKSGVDDGLTFYHPDTDTNTPRRLTLAHDLSTAVANGELGVVYQPKVRLADGQVTGFECLLRWNHPTFGPIGPDEFIPLAERTGNILQLTEYVLHTALLQLAAWQLNGHHWTVAVNLSMRNLLDSSLVNTVAQLIDETHVDPAMVTLEITESTVMADANRTIAALAQLSALGLKLSIDDFGTGYSSLSYLQRLPVDEVKIDKSFVQPMSTDAGAEAIVRSILDLARNIGLSVTAEGVEDRTTWDRLRSLGCDNCQGYYFARPVQAHDIPACVAHIAELTEPVASTR